MQKTELQQNLYNMIEMSQMCVAALDVRIDDIIKTLDTMDDDIYGLHVDGDNGYILCPQCGRELFGLKYTESRETGHTDIIYHDLELGTRVTLIIVRDDYVDGYCICPMCGEELNAVDIDAGQQIVKYNMLLMNILCSIKECAQ